MDPCGPIWTNTSHRKTCDIPHLTKYAHWPNIFCFGSDREAYLRQKTIGWKNCWKRLPCHDSQSRFIWGTAKQHQAQTFPSTRKHSTYFDSYQLTCPYVQESAVLRLVAPLSFSNQDTKGRSKSVFLPSSGLSDTSGVLSLPDLFGSLRLDPGPPRRRHKKGVLKREDLKMTKKTSQDLIRISDCSVQVQWLTVFSVYDWLPSIFRHTILYTQSFTPWKIHMEHNDGGLGRLFYFPSRWLFGFMLIFSGIHKVSLFFFVIFVCKHLFPRPCTEILKTSHLSMALRLLCHHVAGYNQMSWSWQSPGAAWSSMINHDHPIPMIRTPLTRPEKCLDVGLPWAEICILLIYIYIYIDYW